MTIGSTSRRHVIRELSGSGVDRFSERSGLYVLAVAARILVSEMVFHHAIGRDVYLDSQYSV